ncbi:hypothetical protein [Leptolyngbya sp. FACHB-711]|uniref:hypothetical protein n=1 Tax=Leptolyngbya sp. FACHB-711 TaxID=2692813 RepID=UPI0016835595|nr:hypothetical protein [Leptolyngbya sp. FACHB-711]MBD2025253.1 hypothetical protein [Leptolyngbya sp. FACHB-711]
MKRLTNLFHPRSLLGYAAISLGIIIGTNAAIGEFRADVADRYEVSQQQWGRFQGYVFSLMPTVLGSTLVFYALSQLLATTDEADRRALKQLAERKLASPLLTDEETVFWSRVVEESSHER